MISLENVLSKLVENPKKLFLVDGVGALFSAFLLGVVLVKFERYFGIPTLTLLVLATIPIIYVLYDIYAYWSKSNKVSQLLKEIAILNLMYCAISMGFAFYHLETITILGWIYIIMEILIILTIVLIEMRVAIRIK